MNVDDRITELLEYTSDLGLITGTTREVKFFAWFNDGLTLSASRIVNAQVAA
jgi:hypothetical protein